MNWKKWLLGVIAVAVVMVGVSMVGTSFAEPQKVAPKSLELTGVWNCNDGGVYYIRQVGNTVWWMGLSNNGVGSNWSNVFNGSVDGLNVSGRWADVPRGTIMNSGSISVKYAYTSTKETLTRLSATGGFGGTLWWRAVIH